MSELQIFNFIDFLTRYGIVYEDTQLSKLDLPIISQFGPWIAGGAIRRTIIKEKLNSDIDIFFRNIEQYEEFKLALDARDYIKKKENQFNITYIKNDIEVQLININFYQSPLEIINSFDFTICQFVFDGTYLYCGKTALWDLARKRLVVNKITYAIASMRRIIKYTKQGFYACNGTMNAILESVIKNPEIINMEVSSID